MPFSSPPPRYVSVIGLDAQDHRSSGLGRKKTVSNGKTRVNLPVSPKIAPATTTYSNSNASDEGLPTYDEALNREQEGEDGGNSAAAAAAVIRVSMV